MFSQVKERLDLRRGAALQIDGRARSVWIDPSAQRCCCASNAASPRSSRNEHVRGVGEAPAAQLRAIREVEILGHRIGLPPTGPHQAGPPPDPRGAVEVEKEVASLSGGMIHEEVAVEHRRLQPRDQALLLVEVSPARLHHANGRIGEGHRRRKPAGGVGTKTARNRRSLFEPCRERPPKISGAIRAGGGRSGTPGRWRRPLPRGLARRVGRVVEHLHLKPIPGPVEQAGRIDQPGDDMALVVDRKRTVTRRRNRGQGGEGGAGRCRR